MNVLGQLPQNHVDNNLDLLSQVLLLSNHRREPVPEDVEKRVYCVVHDDAEVVEAFEVEDCSRICKVQVQVVNINLKLFVLIKVGRHIDLEVGSIEVNLEEADISSDRWVSDELVIQVKLNGEIADFKRDPVLSKEQDRRIGVN